jgi:hypothetical protein
MVAIPYKQGVVAQGVCQTWASGCLHDADASLGENILLLPLKVLWYVSILDFIACPPLLNASDIGLKCQCCCCCCAVAHMLLS